MKYLRKIFENFSDSELTELKETCEQYLAYLLDEDFSIKIDNSYYLDIDILVPKTGKYSEQGWIDSEVGLSWSDVKDQIIPLILLFKRGNFDYRLKSVHFFFYDYDELELSGKELDDLIDDSSEYLDSLENSGISCISVRVKE